ncbi:MAG: SpaH/EbpB family LPXTG-anchored major pilin [Promicromonosporaceae bacterium]|nr:SpaH/EbpB family LPXTG-anchored major pilin [Promicromonosporaceae bacterium]
MDSNSQTLRWFLRGRGSLAVLAAAGVLITLGVLPAGADPNPLPDDTPVNLHLALLEAPPEVGLEADGTAQATSNAGIDGATFVVTKHSDVDLLTPDGWAQAQLLTPATFGLHPVTATGVTAGGGLLSFTGLEAGLYLVEATAVPPGAVAPSPFVITLPMTNPAGNDWMYDVYAYPKGGQYGIDKTVDDDAALQVGDVVTWTITADIPLHSDVVPITSFVITDTLDSRLTFASATHDAPATYFTETQVGQDITWTATAAGLAAMNDPGAGGTISFTLVTIVNSVGDGTIPNRADLVINGGATIFAEDQTLWGEITLHKVSAVDGEDLAGAVFRAFASEEDALAGIDRLSINSVDEWTTDASGLLTISGFKRDSTVYLVEAQAPTGFELLTQPIPVTVNAATVTIEVDNVPQYGGFTLPLTGGQGLALFAGVSALGACTVVMILTRRRARGMG